MVAPPIEESPANGVQASAGARLGSLGLGVLSCALLVPLIWALTAIGMASGELLGRAARALPSQSITLLIVALVSAGTYSGALRLSSLGHLVAGLVLGLIALVGLIDQTLLHVAARIDGSPDLTIPLDVSLGYGTLFPVSAALIGFAAGAAIDARRSTKSSIAGEVAIAALAIAAGLAATMLLLDASESYFRQITHYFIPDSLQVLSVVIGLLLASALLGVAAGLAANAPWGGGIFGLLLAGFTFIGLFAPGLLAGLGALGIWRQLTLPTMVSLPLVAVIFVGSSTGFLLRRRHDAKALALR